MKKNSFKNSLLWVFVLLASCVDSYVPPAISVTSDFLVVEGSIDMNNASGQVTLKRTQDLTESGSPNSETGAKVTIEEENGSTFLLTEGDSGVYQVSGLPVNYGTKYRLRIVTTGKSEYLSDYVLPKQTPEIDSITFLDKSGGLSVCVNAHDNTNSTLYYRWQYMETWEYHSGGRSDYVVDTLVDENNVPVRDPETNKLIKVIVPRTEDVFFCWRSENSKSILVSSSVKLSEDIISNFPLTLAGPQKTDVKYRIRVKQYGISKEEYAYWELLKKSNENTGGLFSPQPSQVTGNLKCISDSKEVVIGFFSAYDTQEKIVYRGSEPSRDPINRYRYEITCPYTLETEGTIFEDNYNVVNSYIIESRTINQAVFWVVAGKFCADCRYSGGGQNVKPDFWE